MNSRESYSQRLFRTIFNSRVNLNARRTSELEDRIQHLEKDVEQLSLLCLSLVTTIQEAKLIEARELDAVMARLEKQGEFGADSSLEEFWEPLPSPHKPLPSPHKPKARSPRKTPRRPTPPPRHRPRKS